MPSPLVPAEVDLRDFKYMELDVRLLRDSRFAAQVSGDAFRAGVLLWCAAWHQSPCSSLPDDDIELANLAGYGRFHDEWHKVKAEALIGFVKCSDGRFYHETVAEKALAAWNARLQHHYERAKDRLRKANKAREAKSLPPLLELTFDQWNALRLSKGVPAEKADASIELPPETLKPAGGVPAENALKGNGTERNGEGDGEGEKEVKKKKSARSVSDGPVELKTWIDALKPKGEVAVPADDAVFAYAAKIGLPRGFLHLAWQEFRSRYTEIETKRYRDWRAVFRKAVRGNWLKLWYLADDQYLLTTVGQQAQRLHSEGGAP